MDVTEILELALVEVEKAKVPSDLRVAAYQAAVGLISRRVELAAATGDGRQEGLGTRGSAGSVRSPTPHVTDPSFSEKVFFEKVGRQTGIQPGKLEELFHLEEGEPRFSVAARVLGDSQKSRIVAIAQAIPVLRYFGLDEAETPTRVVRAECARMKALDAKNFNVHVAHLDGIVYVGSGKERKLKVRPGATKAFAQLVDRLTTQNTENETHR